jgi:hypothetical protein
MNMEDDRMLDDIARELFNEHKRTMDNVIAAGHPWRFEFTIAVDGAPASFAITDAGELETFTHEALLFFRMTAAEFVQRIRAAGYAVVRAQ